MEGADDVARQVVSALAPLTGVVGLALGGSRASGTADEFSDVDVGLYYDGDDPPAWLSLRAALIELDDAHQPTALAPYGHWGPWVNGGAWLAVQGVRLDVLLRDLRRVEATVDQCHRGAVEIYYQPGHPHCLTTASYAAEMFYNRVLCDSGQRLTRLRARTDPYPKALQKSLLRQFGWEAGFALDSCSSALARGDLVHVTGSVFRAVSCLTQVVFAVNSTYLLNEKGAIARVRTFPQHPRAYSERVVTALRAVAVDVEGARTAVSVVRALEAEVIDLAHA